MQGNGVFTLAHMITPETLLTLASVRNGWAPGFHYFNIYHHMFYDQ